MMHSYCPGVPNTVLIVVDILGCALLLCVLAACYHSLTFRTFYRNKYRSKLKIAVQLGLNFFSFDSSRNMSDISVLMHLGERLKAHVGLQPLLRVLDSSDLKIE